MREASADTCRFDLLDRDALTRDERRLAQVFGLLVLAHYRTSPLDLRHLLDGPAVSIAVLEYRGQVAATALLTAEGGFDAATARRVYLGRRRLRGHLLPQTLSQHMGLESATRLRGQRIMRIAVHPAAQGRGLGTRLVAALRQRAAETGADYLGASFGADARLLDFWERAGLLPVRIGLTREASTGAHAAVVMRPLSAAGDDLFRSARARLHRHLPQLLCEVLRDLEPPLATRLLRGDAAPARAVLSPDDWRDLVAFAFGLRQYEASPAPIWQLVHRALADPALGDRLTPEEQQVLVAKVMQKRSWKEVADLLQVSGRQAAVEALRAALRRLVPHYGDAPVRHEAERLVRELRGGPDA